MKIKLGFFLIGLVWLVAGMILSYLGCFSSDPCEYSSLIAPLPGVVFLFMAFRKGTSPETEESLKAVSSIYVRRMLVLFAISVIFVWEIAIMKTGYPEWGYFFLTLFFGILLLQQTFKSYKNGGVAFYREGIVGHGLNVASAKTKKFSFWVNTTKTFLAGLFFISLALYLLFSRLI